MQASFLAAPIGGAQDGPRPVQDRERPCGRFALARAGGGRPVSRRVGLVSSWALLPVLPGRSTTVFDDEFAPPLASCVFLMMVCIDCVCFWYEGLRLKLLKPRQRSVPKLSKERGFVSPYGRAMGFIMMFRGLLLGHALRVQAQAFHVEFLGVC